jgi:predicted transcriptional regulator
MIDLEKIRAEMAAHRTADISRATGLHRNTILRIKKGQITPQIDTLNVLLKFLEAQKSAAK